MKKMIVEMTGKTVNEAVDAALAELEATIDEVDIEILQEPSSGFLGLGKKPAKVVVKMIGYEPEEEKEEEKTEVKAEIKKEEVKEEIKKEETVQKEEVKEEEKQSRPQRTTDPIVTAEKFLKEVFDSMNIEAEMESELVDNKQLKINIKGNEMGVIIGKRGQTLDSLQYLTNLVINKGESPYISVTLNTESYRERRKETLESLAFNLAKKAKHLRKNVILEPMNPYERRIIHSTLQNDRYVTTYSEGTEPHRYVVISPKKHY